MSAALIAALRDVRSALLMPEYLTAEKRSSLISKIDAALAPAHPGRPKQAMLARQYDACMRAADLMVPELFCKDAPMTLNGIASPFWKGVFMIPMLGHDKPPATPADAAFRAGVDWGAALFANDRERYETLLKNYRPGGKTVAIPNFRAMVRP